MKGHLLGEIDLVGGQPRGRLHLVQEALGISPRGHHGDRLAVGRDERCSASARNDAEVERDEERQEEKEDRALQPEAAERCAGRALGLGSLLPRHGIVGLSPLLPY